VWGKTLGIVGSGELTSMARARERLQMKVIYTDAQRAPSEVERG